MSDAESSISAVAGNSGGNFWYGSVTLQVSYDVSVNLDTLETLLVPVLGRDPHQEEQVNGRSFQSDERIRRLEDDKQSLALQVSVLSEQVEAQAEKIRDMESCSHDHRQRLSDANKVLQKMTIECDCELQHSEQLYLYYRNMQFVDLHSQVNVVFEEEFLIFNFYDIIALALVANNFNLNFTAKGSAV
ncbi:hypothetical protein RRG08_042967 [Elysia crispata]|uniref:Liprin-beta-1/2 coiled-coil domain-containing protein n=1 Tax=Elysia crispata TaxID=231223 RepID=A0AAE1E7Q2_9GAST|nr:hypothetical protein RRG08_042967 [Elysia crispata]